MPHCILEASDNLLDQPDWSGLLRTVNQTLAGTGLFQLADIKSRFLRHGTYAIGDGAPDRAFVTLTVQILDGRADEVKAQLSDLLLEALKPAFPATSAAMRFSLTVQIADLHRPSYRRHTTCSS
jgi:5-carboxymethyl-2-hydroxymuconate isomerase